MIEKKITFVLLTHELAHPTITVSKALSERTLTPRAATRTHLGVCHAGHSVIACNPVVDKQECYLTMMMIISVSSHYVNASYPRPWKVRYYPKKTMFRKADLIDRGCVVFIKDCPKIYKRYVVCARHYDGAYKTFNNYCEMEYENCNSWRKWILVKQQRC